MSEFKVWIDQDLCTGDGLCVDHCPEVFVLLEDGISYVHDGQWIGNDPGQWDSLVTIPEELPEIRDRVITAAEVCPGECIFIEIDAGQTESREFDLGSPARNRAVTAGRS